MTPEEFRIAAHELVDWIADHRARVEERRVGAAVEPGDVRRSLPDMPPTGTSPPSELLADLESKIVPGITEIQHPMFFGWFPSNATLSSVLGDFASSGLGSLGISWESSPALTEVEEVVCDWLRQLTGLSDSWVGVIQDTASSAALVAMIAARERITDHAQERGGVGGLNEPLCVYVTEQAHSSIRKAALLGGFGADHLRMVRTDPWTRDMDTAHLKELMDTDVAHGAVPAVVVASVGSTSTTAFDPVDRIVEVARRHEAWVHVDAAMAGSAMLLPECRHLWEGVEGADSISWNPHKWMGTILDCSLFYIRDPDHVTRTMSTHPHYLRSSVDEHVTQYRDWGIPLGRRFRSLKLWYQLRIDGIESIQDRLRRDLANALWLEQEIAATPGWEVVAPVRLQTVCVRHRPAVAGAALVGEALDRHTLGWVERIKRTGEAFLTPSMLDDEWMVRVSIGVESTERRHIERLWALMQQAVQKPDLH